MEKMITPEKFETRRLTENDWQKYKEIRLESLRNDPQAFGRSFKEEAQHPDAYWKELLQRQNRVAYGTESGKKIVSVANARELENKSWMIIGVYTSPEARGNNLSSRLIGAITKELAQKGVERVELSVNQDQEVAIRTYQKLGFQTLETLKDILLGDGEKHDMLIMEKFLDVGPKDPK